MKNKLSWKMISLILVIATLMTALPLTVFAEEVNKETTEQPQGAYIKDIKLVQASSYSDAVIKMNGYDVIQANLNDGTDGEGVYLGYLGTTDPTQAIYDIKLVNMKGGFTRTSMEKALEAQMNALSEMAVDLEYLVDEFVEAYDAGTAPAKSAYTALNFFRVVDGETELVEENGLGYQMVNNNVTTKMLTEILLFCNPNIVDTIVKVLTMGIQTRNGNWLAELSELGPYDSDVEYMADEEELLRRAELLLPVLQLYSDIYNTMDRSGLLPDGFDENLNPIYDDKDNDTEDSTEPDTPPSPEDLDLQKADESRYKFYKIAADELAKYSYGEDGETLLDFFSSLAEEEDEKLVYPLVSVLSDAEFSSLSYGCFLEMATSAGATENDYANYDAVYEQLTADEASIYLYLGVDKALFDDEAIVGFTDTAQRHMAQTGELNFYEGDNVDERVWGDATRVVKCIGVACLAVVGLAKITGGIASIVAFYTVAAGATQSVVLAGTIRWGATIGGLKGLIAAVIIVVICLIISYIWAVVEDNLSDNIDWDDDPLLDYMYDVKEVSLTQTSDDGVQTNPTRRAVYTLYEAVTDFDGNPMDLNAFYGEGEWLQMFVSYDRQGDDAKPINYHNFIAQFGDGQTPEGYEPLSRFGETYAYNLNAGDLEDRVNGIYMFYQQDKNVSVDSGVTYYISEVQLQSGESDAHCIKLLQDAGYTPLNVNLSPDLTDDDLLFKDKIYTYIGYKVTTSPDCALRDIRMVYGPDQGPIQYGAATYAACGSNGHITLYTTKYTMTGTPILAGSLICVNKQADAADGYEPVCLMSGGPAVPVNVNNKGVAHEDNGFMYLYFLPETSFVSGKQYLGGLAALRGDVGVGVYSAGQASTSEVAYDMWGDYVSFANPGGALDERYSGMIYYYPTYNPYRAVYGIKGAGGVNFEPPNFMVIDSTPYYKWNVINWGFAAENNDSSMAKLMIQTTGKVEYMDECAFYLMGNPDVKNVYNAAELKMSKVQPLEISDVLMFYWNSDYTVPDSYYPVTNALASRYDEPVLYGGYSNGLVIYTKQKSEERPYVSNVFAVDQFSLYREYGGAEAGVTIDMITDSMLTSALVNQGATDILGTFTMQKTHFWYTYLRILDRMNVTKLGMAKTSEKSKGLTDVFFYFNGFSADEPPKTLNRGSVKYTLLCQIPYNLLGSDDMPTTGVYLYGTTSTKAGSKIVDLQASHFPYMEGYETVRTMDGNSLMSEIRAYALAQKDANPMGKADDFYHALYKFFDNEDGIAQMPYYYIHIRREGVAITLDAEDDTTEGDATEGDKKITIVTNGKLYIDKLYYARGGSQHLVWENLLAQGAEGFVNYNLNSGAGGDIIYLGYSYTTDPAKAIKEIRTYHQKNPPSTLTDEDGRVFTLLGDLNVNHGAGGNQIYLYTTTGLDTDDPICSIDSSFWIMSKPSSEAWVGGYEATKTITCAKQWNSTVISDLNEGTDGDKVYLQYTTVDAHLLVPEITIDYGADLVYTRSDYTSKSENGKYIGGVYVMDKETIRLEKIKNGTLPASATCNDITDDEVFARLTAMGATTIIKTPINVNNSGYFKNNANKVFLGYSRTDKSSKAIRNLAIKAEIMSLDDPAEDIVIKNKSYSLVAEAAKKVTELPKAINLIGIEGGADLNLPRLYLYYSTASGSDPIYDITIDDLPLINGLNTVRSANVVDPFTDIYQQAKDMKKRIDDDGLLSKYEEVYEDELSSWLGEIADLFNPEDANATPFYIHVKRYEGATLEEMKPYIGEIFIAEGGSKHESLANLVAYEPDGFIEVNLNQGAGGSKIYMGYKRVAQSKDALTNIAVFKGKKFEPTRKINIDGNSVSFKLVSDLDLDKGVVGSDYLYLYTTNSKYAGNPIIDLYIETYTTKYVKCDVEMATVELADGNDFTSYYVCLNSSTLGDRIFMIMAREATGEGHSLGNRLNDWYVNPTCDKDGGHIGLYQCEYCEEYFEKVLMAYPALGEHVDGNDSNHDCDVCGEPDITEHVWDYYGGFDNNGKRYITMCCTVCDLEEPFPYPIASLFGTGSIIAVVSMTGIAILAAIFIFLKKIKTLTSVSDGVNEHEEIN